MTGFVEVSQNEMMVVDGGGPTDALTVAAIIGCVAGGAVVGFTITGGQPLGALIGAGVGLVSGGALLMLYF